MNDVNPQNPLPLEYKPRKGKNVYFRRALRYLYPYRRIVIISIASAFLVGLIFTSGLAAMLPILRVLLNGDTLQGWVDRQIVEQRLGVSLEDGGAKITKLKDKFPAKA